MHVWGHRHVVLQREPVTERHADRYAEQGSAGTERDVRAQCPEQLERLVRVLRDELHRVRPTEESDDVAVPCCQSGVDRELLLTRDHALTPLREEARSVAVRRSHTEVELTIYDMRLLERRVGPRLPLDWRGEHDEPRRSEASRDHCGRGAPHG